MREHRESFAGEGERELRLPQQGRRHGPVPGKGFTLGSEMRKVAHTVKQHQGGGAGDEERERRGHGECKGRAGRGGLEGILWTCGWSCSRIFGT